MLLRTDGVGILFLLSVGSHARAEFNRPGASPKHIALVGGMLLDGSETPPLHHATVLIEGNKIIQVGRHPKSRFQPTPS